MWIQESPDGLTIDVPQAMAAIKLSRGAAKKKLAIIKERKSKSEELDNSDNIFIKAGGQYFKLVTVQEASCVEDLLKEEYDKKYEQDKNDLIAQTNAAIEEFKAYAKSTLETGEKEIRTMREKLQNKSLMPEISYAHAKLGLSVVKGDRGSLLWLYHTIYNPQYVDHNPLSPVMIKKLLTPIIIMITTTANNEVLGVETKTLAMDQFRHYHRLSAEGRSRTTGSDCWGAWKHPKNYTTVDDILQMARNAANVLSNINSNSVASQNPVGMPRFSTVKDHVNRGPDKVAIQPAFSKDLERTGMNTVAANRGGWTVAATPQIVMPEAETVDTRPTGTTAGGPIRGNDDVPF